MEKQTAVKLAVAGAAGALQPFVIKKYLITGASDIVVISGLPASMGTFGNLSSLVNNGAGIAAIAAALAGMYRKGPAMLRQSEVQMMLLAYGVPALAIGLAMNFGIINTGVTPMGMQSYRSGPSMTVRSPQPMPVPMSSQPPRIYGAQASSQKFY